MQPIEIKIIFNPLTQKLEVSAPMGGPMEKIVTLGLLEQAKDVVKLYVPRIAGATAIPDLSKLRNGG